MSSSRGAASGRVSAAAAGGADGEIGDSFRDVYVFLAVVFALPWLLWIVEQVTGVTVLFVAAPVSVAIATLVAVLLVRRPGSIPRATALVPLRPAGRLLRYCLIAAGIFLVASALTVALNAVTGIRPADLTGFSGLRHEYAPETTHQTGFPSTVAWQALAASLGQLLLIVPVMFCEEWGWRGYLLGRLRDRLGTWPALVTVGLICGPWHLPFFLGPWWSIGADERQTIIPFTIFCALRACTRRYCCFASCATSGRTSSGTSRSSGTRAPSTRTGTSGRPRRSASSSSRRTKSSGFWSRFVAPAPVSQCGPMTVTTTRLAARLRHSTGSKSVPTGIEVLSRKTSAAPKRADRRLAISTAAKPSSPER